MIKADFSFSGTLKVHLTDVLTAFMPMILNKSLTSEKTFKIMFILLLMSFLWLHTQEPTQNGLATHWLINTGPHPGPALANLLP